MKLGAGDELKAIYVIRDGEAPETEVKGKMISLNRLRIGSRDTKGVKK
jgi:DNA gyrase subunit A